ncbi:MAG: 2-hydroxychromene-2-carboxylate isomerase [Candidatus Competibacteraceae bacterium]|nr:2-hydroxychromene-2-carboxylate isomerase [Candidatus Competibacteraceae bacterium]
MTELTQSSDVPAQIEFWFDFGSNYSHISAMRIEQTAAKRGVSIIWKPFLLGPIFKALGWDTSPFVIYEAMGAYMWKDMVRQCAKYGVPWRQPSAFPRLSVLPLRVALVGVDRPWIGDYCRAIMRRNFVEDRDIHTPEAVGEVLGALGLPAGDLIARAQSEPVKLKLRENTGAAQTLGVFGAPTFFARGEMFWGNDRLDDALDFAAGAPDF